MKCASTIHATAERWPEATVSGTFHNPWVDGFEDERADYCAKCAEWPERMHCFTPEAP